jgi:hypothetical protein
LHFWFHQIGVIADIRKAFLHISSGKEDGDFFRFLWVNEERGLKIFRHIHVTFFVTSNPFLLGAVIYFYLTRYSEGSEQIAQYDRCMIEKLRNSFYVNSCVTSIPYPTELRSFVEKTTLVFAEAPFDLIG